MGPLLPRDYGLIAPGAQLAIIAIVLNTVAAFMVGARLWSRYLNRRIYGKDDAVILLSLAFDVCMTTVTCLSVNYGYGRPAASLTDDDLQQALQLFWALQIVYKAVMCCTKVSILFLYIRVFSQNTNNMKFRLVVYVIMTIVVMYGVASILATFFQCTPVSRAWNKKLDGTCISLTAFWLANAVASISTDFIIFSLPIPIIKQLQLPTRQKIALTFVFTVGAFVVVTSIMRMTTLDPSSKSVDQTAGTLVSTIWTSIECNTGIICACLPMLKGPITKFFPRILNLGSTVRSRRNSIPLRIGSEASSRRQSTLTIPQSTRRYFPNTPGIPQRNGAAPTIKGYDGADDTIPMGMIERSDQFDMTEAEREGSGHEINPAPCHHEQAARLYAPV